MKRKLDKIMPIFLVGFFILNLQGCERKQLNSTNELKWGDQEIIISAYNIEKRYIDKKEMVFLFARIMIDNSNDEWERANLTCIEADLDGELSSNVAIDTFSTVLAYDFNLNKGINRINVYWAFSNAKDSGGIAGKHLNFGLLENCNLLLRENDPLVGPASRVHTNQ